MTAGDCEVLIKAIETVIQKHPEAKLDFEEPCDMYICHAMVENVEDWVRAHLDPSDYAADVAGLLQVRAGFVLDDEISTIEILHLLERHEHGLNAYHKCTREELHQFCCSSHAESCFQAKQRL